MTQPLATPAFHALVLTPAELALVRRAVEGLPEREREAKRAVLEMLQAPLAPGDLAAVCGEGEPRTGVLGGPAISANGSGRA